MWTKTDYELAEIADALNIEKEMVGEDNLPIVDNQK
jgi:predicted DNA-binding protein YlxM (UPF0122 family)